MIRKTLATIAVLGLCSSAFAGTGYLKGERTSGLNKICYYNGASGDFSKTVGSAQLCPQSASDGRGFSSSNNNNSGMNTVQPTSNTGFLTGETTNGLNKICYYNSARGTFTKTVGSAQLCKVSAKQ